MEPAMLIPVIMVPIYLLGYIIVGVLGLRKRVHNTSSSCKKSMLSTQDFSHIADALYTSETSCRRIYDGEASKRSVYFRTDTVVPESFKEKSRCCTCSAEFWDSLWRWYEVLQIFPMPLLNMLDHVSDITMTVHFLSVETTRNLGYISVSILILQRVASAAILGDHYGWVTGVRQFFDIEVFFAMYRSISRHRTVLQVIQLKILEGFYESFPEMCIQTYYLVKDSHESKAGSMIYISIALSMLSLSKCWLFSDEVAIPQSGLSCRFKSNAANISDRSIEIRDDVLQVNSFSSNLCMLIMWAWRFGEITITLCIIVAFANVISAKYSFVLVGLLFSGTYILHKIWPQSRQASWFYQVSKYSHSQLFTSISDMGSQDIIDVIEYRRNCWDDFWEELWYYCNYMYRLFIFCVLWFAELNYSFWALPVFYPKMPVILYNLVKVLLQVVLLTACIVSRVNEGSRGIEMLWHEIFNELWYFYIIGLFSYIFGGLATWLFVLDTDQYKQAVEADPNFLLRMVELKQWTLIERLMRNGVCSVFKIIEDANDWMIDNNVRPTDEKAIENFATEEAYCKLLYYLINSKIIRLGPRDEKISPMDVSLPKYYRYYAVPALLRKCNHTRENTTRSFLATTVLSKLIEKRYSISMGVTRPIHYTTIRDAGASLEFIRYHLDAPEFCFNKQGIFECTAKQLYESGFDLLFCLRADFTKEELVHAGFDAEVLSNETVLSKDEYGIWPSTIEHLKRLKQSGFSEFNKLNFTFEELKATNVFTPHELLAYGQRFVFHRSIDSVDSLFVIKPSNVDDFNSSRQDQVMVMKLKGSSNIELVNIL